MFNVVSAAATSVFYSEPAMVEELYTGYLIKSPAQPALTKNTVRLILQFKLKTKYLLSVKDSSSVRETKQLYLL